MNDLISRQAAIETVMECYDNDELFEVYEDKLRELPPAQPAKVATDINVGDKDTISRKAAIEEIERWLGYIDDDMVRRMQIGMKRLPPAQPEHIKGRWVEKPHVHGVAYCSLCDYELHTNDTNFCPNCGADMREVTT